MIGPIRILAFVSAAATVSIFSQVAAATLVKAVPIVVETHADRSAPRVFTLRSLVAGSARTSDTGSAVVTLRSGTRHLRGTLVLAGKRGTLSLRWTGERSTRNGSCGRVAGTWLVADGTGTYTGRTGRGVFAADATFTATRFRGMLIVAL